MYRISSSKSRSGDAWRRVSLRNHRRVTTGDRIGATVQRYDRSVCKYPTGRRLSRDEYNGRAVMPHRAQPRRLLIKYHFVNKCRNPFSSKVFMPRNSVRVSSIAFMVTCAVLAAPVARAQVVQSAMVPVLPVLVTAGQGEAKVTPDRASVLVNVQTRGLTAATAAAENAQKTRAVLDALLKLGIPKEQLSTEGYTVYPELRYDREGGSPRVTGYVVTNTVRAETHHPEQAGAIVDAAVAAGANLINSLSFYASNIDEPRRKAIALAVASARADAEAMAQAAGGSLGGLLELSTQGPTIPPRPMYDMAAMAARKTMQAEAATANPGMPTGSIYVNAKWQFMPAR